MMAVLGGWRDGRAGLAWCTLQAFYEYLIVLKVHELNHPEYLTGVKAELEPDGEGLALEGISVAAGVTAPPVQ